MKKALMIIGGFVVGIIILAIIIITIVSSTSKKLVCKSDQGNITLLYNNKTLTGYKAVNMSFDLDKQKSIVEQIGIDSYLDEFSKWFSENTSGICER